MKNLLFSIVFWLLPFSLIAQEPIELFQQFNGQYDFTAFGNTLNLAENGGGAGCDILTESSADLNLLPGQNILAALLYWAGSGTGDFEVQLSRGLNTTAVTSSRNFALDFQGRLFFGAYADVTSFVQNAGQGNYTLSNLDLQAVIQGEYCQTGTNFGGWSIVVIYEDLTLPLNQISVFDGFDYVANSNPQINFTLDNLDIASSDFAKIGFLAWEGDVGIANNETLRINGTIMNNALNPGNNAFNGTNSYTNSSDLYNMDLDFYDVDGVVAPGDTDVDIQLTSSQDLVIVHNVVTSVNSELPDATIVIDQIGILCDNGELEVDYTVFNVNATEPLAAGIPIAFYADGLLVGQSITLTEIPIDGFESGSVVVNIPVGTLPDPFTLTAVVDDDGTGTGILSENNEDNNEFDVIVQLSEITINIGEDITIANGTAPCEGSTATIQTVIVSGTSYQWFVFDTVTGTFVVIVGETGPVLTINTPGEYRLEVVTSSGCIASDEIIVEFFPLPEPGVPDALTICDDDNDGVALFTLTDANTQIIAGAAGVFVQYYETQAAADTGDITTALVSPYQNTSNPQIVFARLENIAEGCFDTVALELIVFDTPVFIDPIPDFVLCDEDADGFTVFDLSSWDAQVTATPADLGITYYETLGDAQANTNEIAPANAYTNTSSPQIIFVRLENTDGCSAISQFNLIVNPLPIYTTPSIEPLCDYDGVLDESTEFDLSEVTTITTGDDPAFVVSYHESQIEAEAGTPALPLLYTNTSNPQTIWTRIADAVTGCFIIDSFTLTVLDTPICKRSCFFKGV